MACPSDAEDRVKPGKAQHLGVVSRVPTLLTYNGAKEMPGQWEPDLEFGGTQGGDSSSSEVV